MRNTKWMVLCLFIGFLLAAGMMSTIPIYMDASLQRMLIKDMEQYQIDNNKYKGNVYYRSLKLRKVTVTTVPISTSVPAGGSCAIATAPVPLR